METLIIQPIVILTVMVIVLEMPLMIVVVNALVVTQDTKLIVISMIVVTVLVETMVILMEMELVMQTIHHLMVRHPYHLPMFLKVLLRFSSIQICPSMAFNFR